MSEENETTKETAAVGIVIKEKPSGAQRKKDIRKRVKNDKGVWVLEQGWQPHPRVLRGRQSK